MNKSIDYTIKRVIVMNFSFLDSITILERIVYIGEDSDEVLGYLYKFPLYNEDGSPNLTRFGIKDPVGDFYFHVEDRVFIDFNRP